MHVARGAQGPRHHAGNAEGKIRHHLRRGRAAQRGLGVGAWLGILALEDRLEGVEEHVHETSVGTSIVVVEVAVMHVVECIRRERILAL